MVRSRSLAACALLLALASPSTALADSAGNNQYQDPFSTTQPQQTTPTTGSPAPAQPAPSQPAAAPAAAQPSSSPSEAGSQLPRTGLDLRLVAGIGVLLVLGGVLLRRLAASR